MFNILSACQGVATGKPEITGPVVLLGRRLRNLVPAVVSFPNSDFCALLFHVKKEKKKNPASAAAGVYLVRAAPFVGLFS